MFRAGARKVLHRVGFRHPGGGHMFHRTRGLVRQSIFVHHDWRLGGAGRLRFHAWQAVRYCTIWRWESPREFIVDPHYGDARDLAVEVGHWFRVELLPVLERELDLLAVAREREGLGALEDLWVASQIYAVLGLTDDAARARTRYETEAPF
jgi:hypothetical protein